MPIAMSKASKIGLYRLAVGDFRHRLIVLGEASSIAGIP
jgi:hypothetical protein